jgi:RNA polymerase sigma factor (sigma-70 family)
MKRASPATKEGRLLATRHSLVERLTDLGDQRKWQEFFDTYWRLIYGVARKGGLSDAEAQDVVQETVITVSKNITKYERAAGSFKGWLLHITRWRIADQFRKRAPADQPRPARDDSRRATATIDRVPDGFDLDAAWEEEWQRNVLAAALERVKRQVDAKHYQIFDCVVLKHWPVTKVAAALRVSVAQVYLVRHRLSGLVKKAVTAVEKQR